MKVSEFNRVLSLLPELTSTQRETLRHALQYMSSSSRSRGPELLDDWLLDALKREARDRGLLMVGPMPRSMTKPAYKNWVKYSTLFGDVVLKQADNPTAGAKSKLGRIVASAYLDYIQAMKYPGISWPLLFNNAHNLSEALDRAFPGYMGCGMLQHLLHKAVL